MAGMTDFLDALRRGEQPPEYESVLFRIAAINMVPPRTVSNCFIIQNIRFINFQAPGDSGNCGPCHQAFNS